MLLEKNNIDTSKIKDIYYNPKYDLSVDEKLKRTKNSGRKYHIKKINKNIDLLAIIEKNKKELLEYKQRILNNYEFYNMSLSEKAKYIINLKLSDEQIKKIAPFQRNLVIKNYMQVQTESQIRNYIYLIDNYKLEKELKNIRHELVKKLFDLKERECLERIEKKIKQYNM